MKRNAYTWLSSLGYVSEVAVQGCCGERVTLRDGDALGKLWLVKLLRFCGGNELRTKVS